MDKVGKSFYLWGRIHPSVSDCTFLLDTGASVSIMSKTLYEEIPEADRPFLSGTQVSIRAGKSQLIKNYGVTLINLDIQGQQIKHPFWICDVPYSGIIGMDFMEENQAKIDKANTRVYINNQSIRVFDKKGQRLNSKVTARETVVIPANSEKIIAGRVHVYNKDVAKTTAIDAIMEPELCTTSKTGILIGRSVVQINNSETPVRVFNPTDLPITIYKHSTLGVMSIAEEVHLFCLSAEQPTTTNNLMLPKHVQELYYSSCKGLNEKTAESIVFYLKSLFRYFLHRSRRYR